MRCGGAFTNLSFWHYEIGGGEKKKKKSCDKKVRKVKSRKMFYDDLILKRNKQKSM